MKVLYCIGEVITLIYRKQRYTQEERISPLTSRIAAVMSTWCNGILEWDPICWKFIWCVSLSFYIIWKFNDLLISVRFYHIGVRCSHALDLFALVTCGEKSWCCSESADLIVCTYLCLHCRVSNFHLYSKFDLIITDCQFPSRLQWNQDAVYHWNSEYALLPSTFAVIMCMRVCVISGKNLVIVLIITCWYVEPCQEKGSGWVGSWL